MHLPKPQHNFEPVEALFMEGVASRALLESVRLKLYDELETPRSLDQISAALGTVEPAMEAFLDLLEARGLLVKSGGLYANTPLASEFLVSSSFFYQGNALELSQRFNEFVISEMNALLRSTGPAREQTGKNWADFDSMLGIAQYAMRGSLQDAVEFIASLPGFMDMRALCDVGGNHGRYAMALLDRNSEMTAVIADLPKVMPLIEKVCHDAGYDKRISVLPFDLGTDELPPQSYDFVLASHVLYPFSKSLEEVIGKIAASLKPGGWFISHHLDPDGSTSRSYKTIRELVTRLTGHVTHFLPPDDLETALSNTGLTDFKTGKTGPLKDSLILAAKKTYTAKKEEDCE